METNETIIEQMSTFGFSPYETRAYCALLQKSPQNGYEVSRSTGIPPSKIYETLQRLHNKGAVLVYHSDPVLYAPLPYQDLLARLREHTSNAFSTIENYLKHLHTPADTSLTYSLSGNEHVMDTMARISYRSSTTIFAALWDQELELLAAPLRDAHSRGVALQIAIYGTFKLDIPYTYDLTLSGESAEERLHGHRLNTLVADQQEVVVAEFTNGETEQGIWTQNRVIALLATAYIKEEITNRILIDELGTKQYNRLRRKHPSLKAMLAMLSTENLDSKSDN